MGATVSVRYAVTVIRPWPPPIFSSTLRNISVSCRTVATSSAPTLPPNVAAFRVAATASWS